jgi:hypothetical protein
MTNQSAARPEGRVRTTQLQDPAGHLAALLRPFHPQEKSILIIIVREDPNLQQEQLNLQVDLNRLVQRDQLPQNKRPDPPPDDQVLWTVRNQELPVVRAAVSVSPVRILKTTDCSSGESLRVRLGRRGLALVEGCALGVKVN